MITDQTELLTRLNDMTSYIYLQPHLSNIDLVSDLLGGSTGFTSPVDAIISKDDSILKMDGIFLWAS